MENKSLLALIAGIAVGAGLGLFIAPEKGSELRERLGNVLKRTANDLVDSLKSGIDSARVRSNKFEESLEDVGL